MQQSRSLEMTSNLMFFTFICWFFFSRCPGCYWKTHDIPRYSLQHLVWCNGIYFCGFQELFVIFKISIIFVMEIGLNVVHITLTSAFHLSGFVSFCPFFITAFEITIDHPHTHVVKCTQLVRGEHWLFNFVKFLFGYFSLIVSLHLKLLISRF